MATSLDLSRTYTSYSGVDIRVIINGKQAGSMQALSYAIQREKAPIYVMGSVDPISYSRGKRGIAGTMISLMLDTHILMSPVFTGEYYLGDKDEVFAQVSDGGAGSAPARAADTNGLINANNETNTPVALTTVGGQRFGSSLTPFTGAETTPGANASGPYLRSIRETQYDVGNLTSNYSVAPVFYVDQILPFDITIVAVNEYGQSAQMRLYGCEILNEGSGFSIDDIVIENQMTYVCRTILPWRSFNLVGGDNKNLRDGLYDKLRNADNRGADPYTGSNGGGEGFVGPIAPAPVPGQPSSQPAISTPTATAAPAVQRSGSFQNRGGLIGSGIL